MQSPKPEIPVCPLFLSICILISGCYDNNRIDAWTITKRIQPIIDAKAAQCGNRPVAPLFFTKEASPTEVNQCETDMLARTCPFKAYPWSCVRIF